MHTEEEIKNQEDFEALLRDKTEVGKAARDDFERSCKENFKRANTTCDGRLDREQLKNYLELLNEIAVRKGLKRKADSEEYYDMVYSRYNGYNHAIEGVSKDELHFLSKFAGEFN